MVELRRILHDSLCPGIMRNFGSTEWKNPHHMFCFEKGSAYLLTVFTNTNSLAVSKAPLWKNYRNLCIWAPLYPTLMRLEDTLGPLRDIQTLLEEFLYLGVQRRTLAWEWMSEAEEMFYGNPTVKGPGHFKSRRSAYRGIEKLLMTWGTLKRAQESGEILSTKQMI